jgi:hypothetical protein
MHDKDLDIYDLVEILQKRIDILEKTVIKQDQELVLLRNDFEIVKNEGCWLSKQNSEHLHGGHTHD